MNASPHLGQEVERALGPSVSRKWRLRDTVQITQKIMRGKLIWGNMSTSGHDRSFNRATGRADHQRPQCL